MKNTFLLLVALSFFSCKENVKEKLSANAEVAKSIKVKQSKTEITFPSKDGLLITADVYKIDDKPISILLCHQAGFSRGEYKDTALKLNKMGFSVMAIDQRSGKIANDIENETAKRANAKGLAITYLDAKQDIEAAIDYVYKNNNNQGFMLVGSSYSATLSLLIASENDKIKSVAAFSPGEYFKGINIQESIKDLKKPTFVTASKKETPALEVLVSRIKNENLTVYKPQEEGIHGSRALWKTTSGTVNYWNAFSAFLESK